MIAGPGFVMGAARRFGAWGAGLGSGAGRRAMAGMTLGWGTVGKTLGEIGTWGSKGVMRGGNRAAPYIHGASRKAAASGFGAASGALRFAGNAPFRVGGAMARYPRTAGGLMVGAGAYAATAPLRRGDQPFVPF